MAAPSPSSSSLCERLHQDMILEEEQASSCDSGIMAHVSCFLCTWYFLTLHVCLYVCIYILICLCLACAHAHRGVCMLWHTCDGPNFWKLVLSSFVSPGVWTQILSFPCGSKWSSSCMDLFAFTRFVCVGGGECHKCLWRSKGQRITFGSQFSFHHMWPQDGTRVIWCGSKHIYPCGCPIIFILSGCTNALLFWNFLTESDPRTVPSLFHSTEGWVSSLLFSPPSSKGTLVKSVPNMGLFGVKPWRADIF